MSAVHVIDPWLSSRLRGDFESQFQDLDRRMAIGRVAEFPFCFDFCRAFTIRAASLLSLLRLFHLLVTSTVFERRFFSTLCNVALVMWLSVMCWISHVMCKSLVLLSNYSHIRTQDLSMKRCKFGWTQMKCLNSLT